MVISHNSSINIGYRPKFYFWCIPSNKKGVFQKYLKKRVFTFHKVIFFIHFFYASGPFPAFLHSCFKTRPSLTGLFRLQHEAQPLAVPPQQVINRDSCSDGDQLTDWGQMTLKHSKLVSEQRLCYS